MRDYFDSSVLVSAIVKEEPSHESCMAAWLASESRIFLLHGVLESFASLTGGRQPHLRLRARTASAILRENLEAFHARIVAFDMQESMTLLAEAQTAGVRGGAVYDYLHLCAARKAGADRIFTLNKRHSIAIAPDLAPRILHPQDIF